MKNLLAKRQESVLAALAAGRRTLLVFDFDGTLAPIVADRDAAHMLESTTRLFAEVARRYPTAVLSGRALGDLRPRVASAPLRYIVGNHGAEGGPLGARDVERLRATCHRFLEQVAPRLAPVRGVAVEDKGHSLSIHYRASKEPKEAHSTIVGVVGRLRPAPRVVEGKRVVNVMPRGSPHKGDAVRWLRARARAEHVLFVGDDVTDEDAFGEPGEWLVSARVGRAARSCAAYYVPSRAEVDTLLSALVHHRR